MESTGETRKPLIYIHTYSYVQLKKPNCDQPHLLPQTGCHPLRLEEREQLESREASPFWTTRRTTTLVNHKLKSYLIKNMKFIMTPIQIKVS